MIQWILAAIFAAALATFAYKAWHGFQDSIGLPYAEEQRKADQKIVDKAEQGQKLAESETINAKADTATCKTIANTQSKEVEKWKEAANDNFKKAREAKAEAQREATVLAPKIADLQARAAAAPKLMACEQELAQAKSVMQDVLRARRGIPTQSTPK